MFQKFDAYFNEGEASASRAIICLQMGDGVPVQKNRFDREHFIVRRGCGSEQFTTMLIAF